MYPTLGLSCPLTVVGGSHLKISAEPPEPSARVFRGAPFSGNVGVTVPKLHAGAGLLVGAAATGCAVGGAFVAAGLGAGCLVAVRVGADVVTVGSGVTVAGSGVDVIGT